MHLDQFVVRSRSSAPWQGTQGRGATVPSFLDMLGGDSWALGKHRHGSALVSPVVPPVVEFLAMLNISMHPSMLLCRTYSQLQAFAPRDRL